MRCALVSRFHRALQSWAVLVTAQAALLAQSCSYGSLPPRTLDGHVFRWDRVEMLEGGMPDSQVRALLGEPFEIVPVDSDSIRWRYYERARPKGDVVKLLGLIPVSTPAAQSMEVNIVFRHNVVENIRIRLSEGEGTFP